MGADPNVYPAFRYRDADAGLEFLKAAFGFEEVAVHRDESGTIAHAELHLGPGIVMFGALRENREGGVDIKDGCASTYVAVDDPDAVYERAVAAGATTVLEPYDSDHGSRDFTVSDPEGNLWSFGTYRPVAPGG